MWNHFLHQLEDLLLKIHLEDFSQIMAILKESYCSQLKINFGWKKNDTLTIFLILLVVFNLLLVVTLHFCYFVNLIAKLPSWNQLIFTNSAIHFVSCKICKNNNVRYCEDGLKFKGSSEVLCTSICSNTFWQKSFSFKIMLPNLQMAWASI